MPAAINNAAAMTIISRTKYLFITTTRETLFDGKHVVVSTGGQVSIRYRHASVTYDIVNLITISGERERQPRSVLISQLLRQVALTVSLRQQEAQRIICL